MRERAETKFQRDLVARVEYEREVLEMKAEKQRQALVKRVRMANKQSVAEWYYLNN